MALNIRDLLGEGRQRNLLQFQENPRTIRYIELGKSYPQTPEEQIRAALYVKLTVHDGIATEQIRIEHNRMDMCVCDATGRIQSLYECKSACRTESDRQAAMQQARSYASPRGIQEVYIAFGSEADLFGSGDDLLIQEVPLTFEPPVVQPPPERFSPIVVSIINLKGGVGKTSLTCALADFLAKRYNKKVLVIDLDPQTNATVVLMGEEKWKQERDDKKLTLAHYFERKIESSSARGNVLDPKEILFRQASNIGGGVEGLDLLPSSPFFLEVEDRIRNIPSQRYGAGGSVSVLDEITTPLISEYRYDYLLIDCPPSLGPLTLNGLYISGYYLIPCLPNWLSTYGIPQIMKTAHEFALEHHKRLDCLGIVFCRYRTGVKLHENTISRFQAYQHEEVRNLPGVYYPKVFSTGISETVKAEEVIDPDRKPTALNRKYGYGSPPLFNQYANVTQEFLQAVEVYERARRGSVP